MFVVAEIVDFHRKIKFEPEHSISAHMITDKDTYAQTTSLEPAGTCFWPILELQAFDEYDFQFSPTVTPLVQVNTCKCLVLFELWKVPPFSFWGNWNNQFYSELKLWICNVKDKLLWFRNPWHGLLLRWNILMNWIVEQQAWKISIHFECYRMDRYWSPTCTETLRMISQIAHSKWIRYHAHF